MCISRTLLFSMLIIGFVSALGQSSDIQLANEYYQQGELDKAKTLYDKLSQDKRAIAQINSNYIEVLSQAGDVKQTKDYFNRIIKWFPGNVAYKVDELAYFYETRDLKSFEKKMQALKSDYAESRFQLSIIGQHLANKRMYAQSADFFLAARSVSGSPNTYALELARIYSLLNDKEGMVDEYLNYAMDGRQQAAYIKNIFQNLLREEDDLTFLETTLIKRMQNAPDNRTYPDLMIWLELQRKNFYGAFLQARALDRREETSGNHTRRVGQIAMDNESWDDAITIFQYLTRTYHQQSSQAFYRKMLIEAKSNLRCSDEDDATPLHYACMEGSMEIAQMLFDAAEAQNGWVMVTKVKL